MKIPHDYPSWKAMAAAHGISYNCWTNRVFNQGWDRARAATTPVHTPQTFTVNGMTATRTAHAERLGIAPDTITKRLQRGMDLASALSIAPRRYRLTPEERVRAKRAARAARVARNKAAIRGYKALTPCKDCGYKFHPEVMEFDHVPGRGKKVAGIAEVLHWPLNRIIAEMAKCDLVCANDHRLRTAARRNSV